MSVSGEKANTAYISKQDPKSLHETETGMKHFISKSVLKEVFEDLHMSHRMGNTFTKSCGGGNGTKKNQNQNTPAHHLVTQHITEVWRTTL